MGLQRRIIRLLIIALLLIMEMDTLHICAEELREEPYEIVFELLVSEPNKDIALVEERINEITEKKIGCRIHLRATEIAEHATVIRQISAENRIDIVICAPTMTLPDMKSLGIVADMTDMLNASPGLTESCGKLLDACRIGGRVCVLPGNMYPATATCLIYSEDIEKKYGIEPPEDLQENYYALESFFEEIMTSEYEGYAATGGNGFSLQFFPERMEGFGDSRCYAFGVLMDGEGGNIRNLYDLELFEEYCRDMSRWHDKGYLDPDSLLSGINLAQSLSLDRVASTIQSCGPENMFSFEHMTGRKYRIIPLGNDLISTENVTEYGLSITTASRRPDLCMKFLELVYTDPEIMNLFNFGVEGIHYVKKSAHIIEQIPDETGVPGYGNLVTTFGNAALHYHREPVTEEYYEALPSYRIDHADISSTYGYSFDPELVSAQVASVRNVIDLYRPGLICGAADVDALLPRFRAALREAGIDEIIEENQRQYDIWRGIVDSTVAGK